MSSIQIRCRTTASFRATATTAHRRPRNLAIFNPHAFKDDLRGLRVAVQGVGQTGADLISQLVGQGAEIVAADINERALADVSSQFSIRTVAPEAIHAQEVDVFAPCDGCSSE